MGAMTRAARRRGVAGLLLVLAAPLAGACSPASPSIAPSGVDGLTVPTAVPDPDDFVDVVDSPWLALDPVPGPRIAGVATTAVPGSGLDRIAGVVDLYAQDVDGNVWWFGRAGEWTLDDPGAEAGLVITETPRRGDGYRSALAPTAGVDLVSEVVEVDAGVQVGTTAYDDSVVIDTRDLTTGRTERSWYVAGVGRVRTELLTAAPSLLD